MDMEKTKVDENALREASSFLKRYLNTEKELIKREDIRALIRSEREEGFYNDDLPRVVLFGKFKSGKSTLLNALLGQKLAATDVLEKTAWAARYWPAPDPFCYIHEEGDGIKEIPVEEFLRKTEEDLYPAEYLKRIRRIDVGHKAHNINFAIVDTPGYGSLNLDNENLALNAINDADMVLFVIDCNGIGDQREAALIEEIKKSGVSILCVAAQYDEDIAHRKTRDEIREMVSRYTPFKPEEIIPVSALQNKYIDELRGICNGLKTRNVSLRQNALNSRRFRQANDVIGLLYDLKKELLYHRSRRLDYIREYEFASRGIRMKMSVFVKEYIGRTLYSEYRQAIVYTLESMSGKNVDGAGMERVLREILPPGYMDRYWKELMEAVSNKMTDLWREEALDEMLPDYDLFTDQTGKGIVMKGLDPGFAGSLSRFGHDEEIVNKGVKAAFKVAGAVTFYQAVLGANAAAITLAGAAVSTGIPIILLGIGLTKYLYDSSNRGANSRIDIEKAVDDHIREFASCVAEGCMENVALIERQIETLQMQKLDSEMKKYLPRGAGIDDEDSSCSRNIRQVEEFKSGISFDNTDMSDLLDEVKDLRKKLEQMKLEKENQDKRLSFYRQRLEENSKVQGDLKKENKRLEEERQSAEKRAGDEAIKAGKAREEEKRLAEEYQAYKRAAEEGKTADQEKITLLKQKKEEAERNRRNAEKRAERAKTRAQDFNNKLNVSRKKAEELEKENEELQLNMEDARVQIKRLNDDLEAAANDKANENSVTRVFNRNRDWLDEQLKSLPELALSDTAKLELALCIEDGRTEDLIGDILRQICNPEFKGRLVSRKTGKSRIDELDTELGIFLVQRFRKKTTVLSITFNENYADNELLRFIMQKNSGQTTILKDKDIKDAFFDLIAKTESCMYIVVPFLNYTASRPVLEEMEKRIGEKRGKNIEFKLLWGLNDDASNPDTRRKNLERLERSRKQVNSFRRRLGDHFMEKETNTHVKLAICDDRCYMLGSMNFLSFSAEYDGDEDSVHHEICELSEDKEVLEELKESYFNW